MRDAAGLSYPASSASRGATVVSKATHVPTLIRDSKFARSQPALLENHGVIAAISLKSFNLPDRLRADCWRLQKAGVYRILRFKSIFETPAWNSEIDYFESNRGCGMGTVPAGE